MSGKLSPFGVVSVCAFVCWAAGVFIERIDMSCAIAEGPDEQKKEGSEGKPPAPALICHFRDDEPRSAFGQGWEARREGMPITVNPFSPVAKSYWFEAFREGYFAYKPISSKGGAA